jgi:hypothetical protein
LGLALRHSLVCWQLLLQIETNSLLQQHAHSQTTPPRPREVEIFFAYIHQKFIPSNRNTVLKELSCPDYFGRVSNN